MNLAAVRDTLTGLQARIVAALEKLDGGKFATDAWTRPEGGGGESRFLEEGAVFERAGVNFSHVKGAALPPSATAARPQLAGRAWEAMGVSLVLHPRNPYCPTVHMNLRAFSAGEAWWFGGGMDLTPYFGFEEDARHFHAACKAATGAHYPRYKRWCDDYFFLKHRNEARGVGGIFFDDLNEPDFDACFSLVKSVGEQFLPAYVPIVEKRRVTPFGEREREFQAWRRGRYVEFNLVYDRGTLFGLQSGGKTEAILMSLPPRVAWRHDWQPPEAKALAEFLRPRDWV